MGDSITIPAPWSWTPSTYWDGNDGSWNTFIVQVGTLPQSFRILPSTNGQETWILDPEGCTKNDPSDCASRRGAFNNGFQTNESSTWKVEGIYELDAQEQTMGYYGNGLYGFDTVVLGNGLNQSQQVVASIADKSFYLGEFGIGPKTINFTTFSNPIANYLSNLVSIKAIPSRSYGYTAGARYRNASASLTLGGFDDKRVSSRMNFSMNADNSRPLQVGIDKILAINTLSGTSNLLPRSTTHYIDSAIPHLWLPSEAIEAFVAAFGLRYDNTTDLFLINETMRQRHIQNQPTLTIVLAAEDSAKTQDIILPYAAFDLQASYPFYNTPTYYFPIRLAHNTSQYSIGRTFLQEAYIIVDWDRQNFSVGQTTFTNDTLLVPILSENQTMSTPDHGLSGGAIAGIVVGCVIAIGLVLVVLILRRRKSEYRAAPEKHPEESGWDVTKWSQHGAKEMPAATTGHEMGHGDALPGVVPELLGSDERMRYELHSDAAVELDTR